MASLDFDVIGEFYKLCFLSITEQQACFWLEGAELKSTSNAFECRQHYSKIF